MNFIENRFANDTKQVVVDGITYYIGDVVTAGRNQGIVKFISEKDLLILINDDSNDNGELKVKRHSSIKHTAQKKQLFYIMQILRGLKFDHLKKAVMKESEIRDYVASVLKANVGGANIEYHLEGYAQLRVDIHVSNNSSYVGIEIKRAEALTRVSDIERLLGQVLFYSAKKYNENFIVAVVGHEHEYTSKIIELKNIIEALRCQFVFLEIPKKLKIDEGANPLFD
ncbi:MAG: hypothetical protein U0Y96_05885 [Candidatus Kapaibacterium sp.]